MMTMMTPGEEVGAGDAHEYAILFWLEIEGAATETIFFDMPVSHSHSLWIPIFIFFFLSSFLHAHTYKPWILLSTSIYIHMGNEIC